MLRASKMGRVAACPASATIRGVETERGTTHADEGTLAHAVAQDLITTGRTEREMPPDMEPNLRAYVGFVGGLSASGSAIESAGSIKLKHCVITGTCDCSAVVGDTLHVIDLKYGYIQIEPYLNWQLICYALMAPSSESVKKVSLTIVQPRGYHRDGPVRTWQFDARSLPIYREQLEGIVERAMAPNPVAVTGEHCRYCPGILCCNTAQQTMQACVDVSGVLQDTGDMPLQEAVAQFEVLKALSDRIKYRLEALEPYAIHKMKKGEAIEGWQCVNKVGRLNWTDKEKALMTADGLGVELRKPDELITPTQAKAIMPPEVVELFSARQSGGTKLEKVDINRAKRILS